MNPFYAKGMNLRAKLLGAAGVLFLIFLLGSGIGFYQTEKFMDVSEQAFFDHKQALEKQGVTDPELIQRHERNYDNLTTYYEQYRQITLGMIIAMLTVLIVLGIYLTRNITAPLQKLVEAMLRIAEGDLTVSLNIRSRRRDEIAQVAGALNVLVDEIRHSLTEVKQAADVVFRGSQELTSATEQLSSSAQEQASSLEESAASMEEMTSTVKHNADNAIEADKLAAEAQEAADEGVVMASSIKRSMDLIHESSNKIANIIGVINDIAFQTNLLALNAAVEAARAGEHGRGFAVVAAEVRNLAQRSATAAKEIKTLIEDSVDKVGDGAHLVSISGSKLEGIVIKAKQVADLVSEISAASQEQASGIEQVNRAIVQMDSVTQSTAAQVEELSSTSQSLAMQAEHMRGMVMRFQINETPISEITGFTPTGGESSGKQGGSVTQRDIGELAQLVSQPKSGVEVSAVKPKGKVNMDHRQKPRQAKISGDDWTEF
jgi:methyl-accepting chemotaxis protein